MSADKFVIGNRTLNLERHTYVMGILNVTPDSFSDGGSYVNLDNALFHAEKMIREGADVLDVGGESTRPGYHMISEEEEIARVCPIIEKVKARFDIPVSLDTYKPSVCKAGIQSGVDMINDIWGLKYAPQMAEIISESGLPYVLMHNRKKTEYTDFFHDVLLDFKESLTIAQTAGIADNKIILDPGIGFAKTYEQNLLLLNRLREVKQLGYPVLLGCSRKSVIGQCLDRAVNERLSGTLATTSLAVIQGCGFVRVHDIKENIDVIRMMEAVLHQENG